MLPGSFSRLGTERAPVMVSTVQTRKATYNASDFFAWADRVHQAMRQDEFISTEQCLKAGQGLQAVQVKPIKGTLQIHSAMCYGDGQHLAVRKMSCFCPKSYSTSGDTKVLVPACQGWDKSKLEFVTSNTHEGEPVQTIVQQTDRQLQTEHSEMPQAEHPDGADQPDESILEGAQNGEQGAVSIRKTVSPGMAIPMLKIRRPDGRLIFNMEITIRR